MAERSGVFVLQGGDSLLPMEPKQFAKEDDFQRLLSRFPELLVGDQVDPQNPRRWVLVSREQSVATGEIGASQWSIDHVFLDQDGVPTLVEVKRQSNSEIRRQVVGQMLDYAANCTTYWSVETLRSGLEKTCNEAGRSVESDLTERLWLPSDGIDAYWGRVKTNLQAKKIRMLFVADVIPIELRRIVEFLNEQMDPAEVLAVELRQFVRMDNDKELRTIVPTVYGQIETARNPGGVRPRWDEERLFEKFKSSSGPKEQQIAKQIYDWMQKGGTRELIFGTGKENGTVYPAFRPNGVSINPVYLSTDGKLWLQFGSLDDKPVFGSMESRRALMERFNAIKNVNLTDADLKKYPGIRLTTIAADPDGGTKILQALSWMEEQIERSN